MACFDEVLSVHDEEMVMCASVHLVSGKRFKCALL